MKGKFLFASALMFVLLGASMMAPADAFARPNGSPATHHHHQTTCKHGKKCKQMKVPTCKQFNALAKRVGNLEKTGKQAGSSGFDWSLGAGGFGLWARGQGPSVYGTEVSASIYLRMVDKVYFTLQGGPGVGWVDGNAHLGLTEFAGVQYRFGGWSLTAGGRHRVVFWRGQDDVNGLFGELQATKTFGDSWFLRLSGAVGGAWHPVVEEVGIHAAGVAPILNQRTVGDWAFTGTIMVGVKF